jgi:hypothetical protein
VGSAPPIDVTVAEVDGGLPRGEPGGRATLVSIEKGLVHELV